MITNPATILVIEDEPAIRRFLKTTLRAHEHRVIEAETAKDGLRAARLENPDLVILDLGLPDLDGIEVIRRLRLVSAVPIVVLSSRDGERAKVEALDLGADDFITKPFGVDELMARLRAALRHAIQEKGGRSIYEHASIKVDLARRFVQVSDEDIRLTPKEFDLLAELIVHAGKVLTHKHLLTKIWADSSEADVQYLRVLVRQLRQKLEPQPAQPSLILTEPGVGYRMAG